MALNTDEQFHVDISRKWTGSFRVITKRYDVPGWRFDPWTVSLLKAMKAKDLPVIADYCKERDGVLFSALNGKEKKRVSVISILGGFTENFAHTSYWDPDYVNYPDLTFIVPDPQHPGSFTEFDELFKQFIQAKTREEIAAFEKLVYRKYKGSNG